jgi:hypothetical protein
MMLTRWPGEIGDNARSYQTAGIAKANILVFRGCIGDDSLDSDSGPATQYMFCKWGAESFGGAAGCTYKGMRVMLARKAALLGHLLSKPPVFPKAKEFWDPIPDMYT